MSSSSDLEVTSAQSQPAQAHPDPWEPQFQINGKPVTTADSVMQDDLTALAVGRNITMPEDVPIFSTMTDTASANGCLILGIRTITVLSSVCNRLRVREEENASKSRLLEHFREQAYSLRDENKRLKSHLKRVRKMREAIARRLIFYQDFVNTKVLKFDEAMEEVQQRMDQIQKTSHQDSQITLSKGHKRSKSLWRRYFLACHLRSKKYSALHKSN